MTTLPKILLSACLLVVVAGCGENQPSKAFVKSEFLNEFEAVEIKEIEFTKGISNEGKNNRVDARIKYKYLKDGKYYTLYWSLWKKENKWDILYKESGRHIIFGPIKDKKEARDIVEKILSYSFGAENINNKESYVVKESGKTWKISAGLASGTSFVVSLSRVEGRILDIKVAK